MSTAVGIGFDVDMETSATAGTAPRAGGTRDPSHLSSREFGVGRGLDRVTGLLDELGIRGTFFVTGLAAERHPDRIGRLARDGHEVAHHGYLHLSPAASTEAEQREEFERGLAALVAASGSAPRGYRAPAFQMSAETFAMVVDAGLLYDSSMMADDRPYRERVGERSVIEIPVHWSLDDVPHVGMSIGLLRTGDPRTLMEHWWTEVESAIDENRPTTFCLHPEVTGRPWVLASFARFLRRLDADPRIRFARHVDLAEEFAATEPAG